MTSKKPPRPVFDKYGGHYHLSISTVDDLAHVLSLADGRWMATSCPQFGLNADPVFLRFLDADGNDRIISDEIRAAVRWLRERLRPSETWTARPSHLPLDLINTDHPDGQALQRAAHHLLHTLNLPDATEISLEQVRNRQKTVAQADYNGDGVMPPNVIKDPETALFARDLIATLGGVPDASGRNGVNEAQLDQFRREAHAYIEWHARGAILEGQNSTAIMPFGTATPTMAQAVAAIRDKIEQFFAQCALVRFDARMTDRMGPRDDELAKLDYKDRGAILEHLRLSPLSKPNPEGILPLDSGANEFYRGPIHTLRTQAILPMFGEEATAITEPQWCELLKKLAPYEAWLTSKPATALESLSVSKLRAYLDGPYDANIRALMVEDKAVAQEIQQWQHLEKLILYYQWLFEFLNNYVSFPHLFDPEHRALFEMGTLVLGGRKFTFSVRVENRGVHSNLAKNSGMYLLYLQVTGAKPEDAFEIAVPVTRGSGDHFYVGRRGVFFTVTGRELDAQIIQMVENSTSLWEAVKAPFRRIFTMIGGRFSQISGAIQKETETSITTTTSVQQSIQAELRQTQKVPEQPAASTAAPLPSTPVVAPGPTESAASRTSGSVRDFMIGTGFLVAGLGTALKFLADAARQLTQPRTLHILLIMMGVFLGVTILATVTSAWAKMRKRDLGVLLQASGWAINGRMRLTRPLARFFTRKTRLPEKARKHRKDRLIPMERRARQKNLV